MQCMNIDIIDDSRVEGEHMFTVEIASVSPASVIQCSLQSTTFHIEDNDGRSQVYTIINKRCMILYLNGLQLH